ncbi:LysR family transcriptional regulator [Vibrio sp. S9_S30]|uniref:LysR family transcriptional regulator n=1 Tax=Vibrio sp. S9_S30 TaxID=2720226 RepID=UPI0016815ACB|nr:LysR family transcriptional regulator [Vibrio sp. S9_S30]MBD1558582.1 LysR family transcriptional regulator [Vibrio sp. S9_S30]
MTKRNALGHIAGTDIRTLKIFKSVVRCGGFSAAESELNISRAAISIAMSDLEQRLSLKLCSRGRSGFSLTPEGEQVYQATIQLLNSHQEFQLKINNIHLDLQGDLDIGITDCLVTMPRMQISDSLKALQEKGPSVRINIEMIPASDVIKGVLDGRLHTGVAPVTDKHPNLNYIYLYNEQSNLYCGKNHPLYLDENRDIHINSLQNFNSIFPSVQQPSDTKKHFNYLKKSAQASNREGVAFLILTGGYIGYLPTHFAKKWVDDGSMKPVLKEQLHFNTTYAAITKKELPTNLVLSSFLDSLQKLAING